MEQQNNEKQSASVGCHGDNHDSNQPQIEKNAEQMNDSQGSSASGQDESSLTSSNEVEPCGANPSQTEKNAEQINDSQGSSASGQDESSLISSNEVEPCGADPSQTEKNAEQMNDSQGSSSSGQDESSLTSSNEVEPCGADPSQDPGGCDVPMEPQKNEKESASVTGHGDSPDSSHQQDEVKTREADRKVDSFVADQTDSRSNSKMSTDHDSVQDNLIEVTEGVMADPVGIAENSPERLQELSQTDKEMPNKSQQEEPPPVVDSSPNSESAESRSTQDSSTETEETRTHPVSDEGNSSQSPGGVTEKAEVDGQLIPCKITDKKQTDGSQFWSILLIVSVLVAFSAIVLVYWLGADVPPPAICNSQDRENCGRFFEENIHRLQEMYPKQDKNMWLTLYSAAVLHVSQNQKPIRPITVLVYSLSEDSKIIEEVSNLYETVLSGEKKNGKIVLDGSELSGKDPEEVHRIIAGSLEKGFQLGKKVAVVHDFDLLPSCSVLAFHNYCNTDDAPYLDVAIILTMRGMVEVGKAPKAKDLERTVGDILHEKWKDCPDDLPPDKIDAILSRIANNVVLVR